MQVTDERDVRGWLGRRSVGEDEHRPVVLAAECAFAVGAAVRVVAAEGAVAGQDRADVGQQALRRRIFGAEVLGQPGHVAARAGDVAVE
ncbi:hypothetical protein NKG94_40380 [Micromonospora sp. M12]